METVIGYYMEQMELKDDDSKRSIFEKMLDMRRASVDQGT